MPQVKNSPVTQVLVTSGNQAVLAAGSQPSALAVGQLGFFNYADHLSIDGSSLPTSKNFYMAVGVDPNGTGALADIQRSAGQYIQRDGVAAINARCYSPERVQIVDITDFKVKCDTEYMVRINFNTAAARAMFGANTPFKSFNAHSGCCTDDCATCPKGDCNKVALDLVNNMNADPEGLFTADLLDYTTETVPGTKDMVVVPLAGYDAWVAAAVAADPDDPACLGIRITGKPEVKQLYSGINRKYDETRGVIMQVTFALGFECTGKVTEFQKAIYSQGDGYDVAYQEWWSKGYNGGGNYELSELLGMPINDNYPIYASKTGKYITIDFVNNVESAVGDWNLYQNGHNTTLAIPCADTTTRTSVVAFIDAIFAGRFDAITNDIAACTDCTTPNTQDSKTALTDGIL